MPLIEARGAAVLLDDQRPGADLGADGGEQFVLGRADSSAAPAWLAASRCAGRAISGHCIHASDDLPGRDRGCGADTGSRLCVRVGAVQQCVI